MRFVLCTIPLLLLLAACGSVEFRDTNAAVDADPLCASAPSQPGEPVALRCKRETSVSYSTRPAEPLDLTGTSRKDDPR